MNDLAEVLARITARLEELESRVAALEHSSRKPQSISESTPHPSEGVQAGAAIPVTPATSMFAVMGRAMLGIAGAYLLRAAGESGLFPKVAVIAIAFVYAGMWLVWAARTPVEARLTSFLYACTSGVILASMLWELTLRFKTLPDSVAASLLDVFVIAALALTWKHNPAPVYWVANLTAVLVALVLMIATRDLLPFVAALLITAFIAEYAANHNRWISSRSFVAVAADLAVWILIYIYSSPENTRPEYKLLSTAVLLVAGPVLFLIYGTSIALRTAMLRHTITWFEIGQTVIAFLLAVMGVLSFGASFGALVLGCFCLFLSAATYTAVFLWFDRPSIYRNYHVYAVWSAALLLAGSFLSLPRMWLVLCLGVAAIVATFLGVRRERLVLESHGLVYLAAAALTSGLLRYAGHVFAGSFPAAPIWIVWIISIFTIVCYALEGDLQENESKQQLIRLLTGALAVCSAATFFVSALVWLMAIGMEPGIPHVAIIRTLAFCGIALALAYGGSRWRRTELVWIAYGVLAFVTAKLLFEDLRHGHAGFVAVSIFLYALALIMLPRLVRLGQGRCSTKTVSLFPFVTRRADLRLKRKHIIP